MSRIKETKSSVALIVAVVALVAALGGGAVAGVTISNLNKKEKNQVKRISKKQAKKLDEKIALLPGPQGPEGATGAQGAKGDIGPTGPTGPQGDPGATNVTYRESTPISVPSGAAGTAQVSCEGNERAVGGGGVLALPLDQNEGDTTIFSIPLVSNSGTPNGWIVKMRNGDPDDARDLYANVICASP